MPTLWKMDASPPACAVRILGDMLGIEFDYMDVNLIKLEHKFPEFMKINPLGTIPVLKDGDFILSDSHAILKYLLEKYGTVEQREALYPPSSLQQRSIIDQAMFFDTGVFFVRLKVVALPTIFGDLAGPTATHQADIEAAYAVVESYLDNRPFIAADHLTLADISVGVTTASMQTIHKLDKTRFPRTAAWLDRLNQIPAFKKYTEPGFEILGLVLKSTWENNKQKQN